MSKQIIFILLITFSNLTFGTNDNSDTKKLNHILNEFLTAISNKDEKEFLDLFYDHSVVFVGVNPDKRTGNLPSNNGLMYSTHVGFIGWIVASPKKVEEKVWDVKIETDGNIASIYFSYSFHMDDKKINWGDEQWSLIKVGEHWKIVSVLFTAKYKE